MNPLRPYHLFAALGILALMVMLYFKTQAVNLQQHNRLLEHINHFKRVDATFNRHLLEIRQGLLRHYDPPEQDMQTLEHLQQEIEAQLQELFPDTPQDLMTPAQTLGQTLAEQRKLFEHFKQHNAVLRNSLRYLPLATNELLAQLPDDRDTLLIELSRLLSDVLVYNLTSDLGLSASLLERANRLATEFDRQLPSLRERLGLLLGHVDQVLENKIQADDLLQRLLGLPTNPQLDALMQAYLGEHDRMMLSVNRHRLALYVLATMLLVYIAFILWQLRRQARRLQRAEARARQNASQLRGILDSALDAIVCIDEQGRISDWNPRAEEMFGWARAEALGARLEDIIIPACLRGKHRKGLEDYFHGRESRILGQRMETTALRRDGSEFPVELTVSSVETDDTRLFSAFIRDISAEKQAAEALEKNRQRLADAQRMAHIGSWELDLASGTLEWSEEVFRIFELDPQHTEPSYELFLERIHPEDRAEVDATFQQAVQRHTPYQIEHRLRLPGGKIKHVLEQGEIFYAADDTPLRAVGTVQDITERVAMEQALRRSQKMEAIGQLSGGIAHDFNNQLGIIIGYLDFLKNHLEGQQKPSRWVETATRATQRCMDLTRQLLSFSRRQGRSEASLNLNDCIDEIKNVIARSVTPEVEVKYFLANPLWTTRADPGELQDAIINLAINARDAMPNGGTLVIETGNIHLDRHYAERNPGVTPGDYVQLNISDTGTGMDAQTLERACEPFFTTKDEGKGTGLGLAMVYGFAKRCGGFVKLYSEPNAGTSVRLYLPRCQDCEVVHAALDDTAREPLPRGNETVLLVDDEPDLLQLAARYLSELGYQVYTAENARQALALLDDPSLPIDILFSDVVMPGGINGYELAQKAVERRPAIKVLLTSGFTSRTLAHNGLARFNANLLPKPYRKDQLAQRIRRVLDQKEHEDLA